MENSPRRFLKDSRNKLFTKMSLVNSYTKKEIERLNQKYLDLGLYIELVPVDKYGKEICSSEESESLSGRPKRKMRKAAMGLKAFFSKYSHEIKEEKKSKYSTKDKNKKPKELLKRNEPCDIEDYIKFRDALTNAINDSEQIPHKECRMENDEFKGIVINFIYEYKQFLTNQEYQTLLAKWKNKHSQTKNVDPSRISELNDLRNWKLSLLKAFKSEIILFAAKNNFCDLITRVGGDGGQGNNNANINIQNYSNNLVNNNRNNRKRKRDEEEDSKSSDEEKDSSSNNDNEDNERRLHFKKMDREDEDSEDNFNK